MVFALTTSRRRHRLSAVIAAATLLLAALVSPAAPAVAQAPAPGWVATWGAAPSALTGENACTDCTVRNTVHTSIGGGQVRIVLSNVMNSAALTVKTTTVSIPAAHDSAAAAPGTMRSVEFGGQSSVTIPAGAYATSDTIDLAIEPDSDLHVTTYADGSPRLTNHSFGLRESTYIATGSDAAHEESADRFSNIGRSFYLVSAVDVLPAAGADAPAGSVVVLGDSITDGVGATSGTDTRWSDFLAKRLRQLPGSLQLGVANAGISGNWILEDSDGHTAAVNRFQRDVLDRAGVRSVIIFEGINDIQQVSELSHANNLIAGIQDMADRAHANGVRVVGATIGPWKGWDHYNPTREAVRVAVNEWIRTSSTFDAVVDFDAILDDPDNPGAMRTDYDSTDHLHPNSVGYDAIADAIDLAVLGSYTSPGSVEIAAPHRVVRNAMTSISARITAEDATAEASAIVRAPQGWVLTSPAVVELGALAAGESVTVTWPVTASTPLGNLAHPRTSVHALVDAEFDGRRTSKSAEVTIVNPSSTPDTTAPTVTIVTNPANPGSNTWFTAPVSTSITTTDADPNLWTQQQIDDSAWEAYVGPTTLTDGKHIVSAISTDSSGNSSAVARTQVNIDTMAPVVTATLDEPTRTVTITATDATAGAALVEFRRGSGPWGQYTAPVSVGASAGTIEFRATDLAGHASAVGQMNIPVASTAPAASTTAVTLRPTKVKYGQAASVDVVVTALDGRPVTGGVTVEEAGAVLAAGTLSAGRSTLTMPKKLTAGTHSLTVRYSGSSIVKASSAAVTLTVAKAASSMTVKAKRTTTTKRGKVTMRVNTAASARGKAKITVKQGKKTVVRTTVKVNKKGKAKLRLPRLSHAGKYKVTVKFRSASAANAKGKTRFTVAR